jgi:hypothetical protein
MPTVYCSVCSKAMVVRPQSMKTIQRETATCGARCFLELLQSARGEMPREAMRNVRDENDSSYTVWSQALRMAFRSGKEKAFAECMAMRGVRFEYEAYALPVGTTISIPDFWIARYRTFVEVKGMWAPGGPGKLQAVRNRYPQIRLLLLSTHIGWDYDKLSAGWQQRPAQVCAHGD